MKLLTAKANKTDLELIVKLTEEGVIIPVIDRRYSFDKAADAMSYLKEGHSSGKVVVIVSP